MVFVEGFPDGYSRDFDAGYEGDEGRAVSKTAVSNDVGTDAREGARVLYGDRRSRGELGDSVFCEFAWRRVALGDRGRKRDADEEYQTGGAGVCDDSAEV